MSLNLEGNLRRFLDGRKPNTRYTSFDYCFNYFQSFRDSGNCAAIASAENMEISCLQLGFYLASWGMLRGSAYLLQRSVRHFVSVVEAIAGMESDIWQIDADEYAESNIHRLLDQAKVLRHAGGNMSDTLVTKIMLGVFGSVPAFDTNFKRGFGVSTFGPKALRNVGSFYQRNAKSLDKYRVPTLDFVTEQPTGRLYTRAKVIDMAFFIQGMSKGEDAHA
jgi:hypothetical protein